MAGAQPAADAEAERRKQFGQRAALSQYHAEAQTNHANSQRFRRLRGFLPIHHYARQEVVAGGRGFGEDLVATRAVVSNG